MAFQPRLVCIYFKGARFRASHLHRQALLHHRQADGGFQKVEWVKSRWHCRWRQTPPATLLSRVTSLEKRKNYSPFMHLFTIANMRAPEGRSALVIARVTTTAAYSAYSRRFEPLWTCHLLWCMPTGEHRYLMPTINWFGEQSNYI